MPQTSIQKQSALRYGSAKLELGPDIGSMVNLGAIRGLQFVSKVENIKINFDNTEEINKFKNGTKASFKLTLNEVDLTTLSVTDDGLVELTSADDTPVPITNEYITLNDTAGVELAYWNSDGTEVASIVVTNLGGTVTYTRNSDYVVSVVDGKTVVARVSGGLITDGQAVYVDYTYTPYDTKTITFNDFGTKEYKVARITNTDPNGKTFVITLANVTNISPLTMPFLADDADDVMGMELELDGTITSIVDEQSVA